MIVIGTLLLVLAGGCESRYGEITRALQANDLNGAQAQLRAVPADCSHSSAFYGLLGVVSELTGDTQGAEKAFQRALTLDPQSIRLHEQLGATYLRNHKADAAAAELRQVLAYDPANATARNYLIAAYVASEQWQAASRLFAQLPTTKFDSRQPVLTLWFAETLVHTGETERLERGLPAATTDMPSAFLFSLGTLLAQHRVYRKALEYFNAIPEKDADEAVYFNAGLAYSHLRRFDEARASYFRTIDLQARHVDAYFRVGVDYAAAGDPRRALPWMFRAHEWAPDRTDITYALSEQLTQLHFFGTAEELLKQGTQPLLLVAQADLQLAKGATAAAASLYNKALLQDNALIPARIGLGRAYAAGGKLDEAVSEIDKALAADKDDAAAIREAGLLAAKQQLWSKAEKYLSGAWALDKSDATVALELARAARNSGKPVEALALLDTAGDPLRKLSAYHLEKSRIYAALKRPEESRQETQAAAALQNTSQQPLRFESPKDYVY